MVYPLLIGVSENSPGCQLTLSNGRRIELAVTAADLATLLANLGYPALPDICRTRRAEVVDRSVAMSADEWAAISGTLRSSPTATNVFRDHHRVLERLDFSYADVVRLPMRLYGGIGPAQYGSRASLYLSPPVDFSPDDSRSGRWYYGLLDGPHGWLFKTWTELSTGEVVVESGCIPGHFVEGHPRGSSRRR